MYSKISRLWHIVSPKLKFAFFVNGFLIWLMFVFIFRFSFTNQPLLYMHVFQAYDFQNYLSIIIFCLYCVRTVIIFCLKIYWNEINQQWFLEPWEHVRFVTANLVIYCLGRVHLKMREVQLKVAQIRFSFFISWAACDLN